MSFEEMKRIIQEEWARRADPEYQALDRTYRKLQMKRRPGETEQEESEHETDGKAAKSGEERQ